MIKKLIVFSLSIIRSILVNFKCLPLAQAIHLPIMLDYRLRIKGKLNKESFVVDAPIRPTMIRIGVESDSFYMGGVIN